MPKIPELETPEEQPQVVQIVYQVPSDEAPMLPEQMSVLENKTGFVIILIFAIWGILWYFFSGDPDGSSKLGTETPISVNDF